MLDDNNCLKPHLRTRVFINLEMVLKVLLTKRVSEYSESLNSVELDRILVSNIINLAQHYRLYLVKNKLPNEVYLYWNFPIQKEYANTVFLPDYRHLYHEKFISEDVEYLVTVLERVHSQLKTIIQYVNEVYLIDGGMVDSGVVPYVIIKNKHDGLCQHVVVTNNRYEFQYIKHGAVIWYPDREDSKILTEDNIYAYLREKLNIKEKFTPSVNFLPFIVAILGDRYRGIDKLPKIGLATILKMLSSGLEQRTVTNSTASVELLKTLLPEEYHEVFERSYKITDVEYQYARITVPQEAYILDQIVDKYDDESLYYLNDRFFKEHLLMIVDSKREQVAKTL